MTLLGLECCEREPKALVEYEVGSAYFVCPKCLELPHFANGIKTKKEIQSVGKLSESPMNTNASTEVSVSC